MMKARNESQDIRVDKTGYDLIANLSEVEKEKIDADYLEEHFKQIVPKLIGNFDEIEKNLAIASFSSQLAVLSIEEQKYAKIIIEDIKNGKLKVEDRTLFALIAEYKFNAEQQEIKKFSNTYSIDYEMLYELIHATENQDIKISKIIESCDKEKIKEKFGCSWFAARAKLNSVIREFVNKKMCF